jgi:hypothetical protein
MQFLTIVATVLWFPMRTDFLSDRIARIPLSVTPIDIR